jgi:LemA protein
MRKLPLIAFIVLAGLALQGCGYNKLQDQDEAVKAAWSDVVNQYQRRADLIPNLVATVKGYAGHEERVLVQVTEARAKATSIQVTPEVLNDAETFRRFQQAQSQLTVAIGGLMRAVEAYPDLKASANFRDLQAQLEGTENRIAVSRNRYIEAVKQYNVTVRKFPSNLVAGMFDFEVRPNFSVENEAEISRPPAVSFDTSTPAQQATPVETPAGTPPAPAN